MAREEKRQITRRQAIQRTVGAAAIVVAQEVLALDTTANPPGAGVAKPHRLRAVPLQRVTVDDAFWTPKLKIWRDVTIGDCFTKFETDRGGAINNFDLTRDGKTGRHAGPPWYDGLIYEMIRGSADFLAVRRDPTLEARIDGYIVRIVAAQAADPSGYLNTWTQAMLPQTQRWGMNGGDDREQHDVYNAGMMIEAGIHYYQATGKSVLLEAATRLANLMCDTIGPPPRANVVPGHSGPEEALVKLYQLYHTTPTTKRSVKAPVKEKRYLELAEFFIDARGHYEGRTGKAKSFAEYGQDHAPLAHQNSLEGHAVRATLFCVGIAAAAHVTDRSDYHAAAQRLWDSLVDHKMYITGAAGAIAGDEKLGPDYFLPNDGYMETCAAAGLGFFSHNMNLLYGEAHYVDELECALYNAVLGGVALSGNRYYYQNPLAGDGLRRWEWHDCPCCPPMFLKIMGALPGYIYAQEPGAVYVNLFVGSQATLDVRGTLVGIHQTTRYPREGGVRFQIQPEKPTAFDLYVRIPGWSQPVDPDDLYQPVGRRLGNAIQLSINGRAVQTLEMVRGYARLRRRWQEGDNVQVEFAMPVRQVRANARVEADRDLVSFARGPVIYCAESVDNSEGINHFVVPPGSSFTPEYDKDLLGGVVVARGKVDTCSLEAGKPRTVSTNLVLIPFYASSNREPCAMRVWLAADVDKAVPLTLATRSRASSSHCWHLDSVAAINDGVVPTRSSDIRNSRLSWWDHKGTTEWAQLSFPEAAEVSKVRVFWFADRPVSGGCDVPATWRLLYQEGNAWRPVDRPSGYEVAIDRFNDVTFSPVRTTALRIEVQLKSGWSGGICEWQVE